MIKKIFIGIGATLATIVILIIAFVIYFVCAVSDSSSTVTPFEDGYTSKAMDIIETNATEALNQDDICFDLTDEELTNILGGILYDLKIPKVSVLGTRVEMNDSDNYLVEAPVKVYGVNTVLRLEFKLEVNASGISVTVYNLKVGKLKADSFLVRKVILSQSVKSKIEASILDMGVVLSITNDFGIQMTEDNLMQTLENVCDPDSRGLFKLLAKLVLTEDYITLEAKNHHFKLEIDMDGLEYTEALSHPLAYTTALNKITNYETIEYKNLTAVFSYYVMGYSDLSDENKEIIDSLGLSKQENGIKEKGKNIAGALVDSSKLLSISEMILHHGVTISLSEDQLNGIMASLAFIGSGICFTDRTRLAYISLEALELGLNENELEVRLIMNLNGKRLCVKALADALPTQGLRIDAKLNKLSVGTHKLADSYIPLVFGYLNDILNEQPWMYCTNEYVVLDFEAVLKENSLIFSLLDSSKTRKTYIEEDYVRIVLGTV